MSLREGLVRDHQRLEALFTRLLAPADADDRDDLRSAWVEFERGLLAHLEAEEDSILPAFDRFHPAEAAVLRADHARFRAKLAELGIALDLHVVRAEVLHAFVAELRAHAAREEAGLYRWGEANVAPREKASILDRLGAHVI